MFSQPAFWARMTPASRGIALFLTAAFVFSIMDTLAKILTASYPPLQVTWARYLGQVVWTMLLLAPWLSGMLRTRYPWLQALRSVLLFGATFMFYSAVSTLRFAEATAIFEVAPLLMTVLAVLILKEQVGPRRWIGVSVGLIGALIIIRPGTDVFSFNALYPVAAAVSFAGYAIATRFLGSDESPWTSFVYTAVFGALAASLMVPAIWEPLSPDDLPLLAFIGLVGGIGQLLLILALRAAPPSVIAPFGYVALLYNGAWGYGLFNEIPDIWTFAGSGLIVGSGLYVWHRERQVRTQP
ncbi:MAG: DMT family transporter [Pseudomonadota bacterium]